MPITRKIITAKYFRYINKLVKEATNAVLPAIAIEGHIKSPRATPAANGIAP